MRDVFDITRTGTWFAQTDIKRVYVSSEAVTDTAIKLVDGYAYS